MVAVAHNDCARGGSPEASLLEDVLELDWFLPFFGRYLPLGAFRVLAYTNRKCKQKIHEWVISWPRSDQQHFQNWSSQVHWSNVLVFGVHSAHPSRHDIMLYKNPMPILRFSLDNLAYDSTSGNFIGRPWSVLITATDYPLSLGRLHPCVCAADRLGGKIFYCGGRIMTESNDSLVSQADLIATVSNVTAIFDVQRLSWRRLPDMPEGRYNAGVFRVGHRIFVLGGEADADHPPQCILQCFDLELEEWLDETDLPPYPGRAFAGFAVGAVDQTTIIVAGGGASKQFHFEIGPIMDATFEVFALDVENCSWSRLPDLPRQVGAWPCFARGVVLSSNEDGGAHKFIVSNGRECYCLSEGAEHWIELSNLVDGSATGCVLAQAGLLALAIDSKGGQVLATDANVWKRLPEPESFAEDWEDPHTFVMSDVGVLSIPNGNGGSFAAYLTFQVTAVPVCNLY
jgi:hypothetical protein